MSRELRAKFEAWWDAKPEDFAIEYESHEKDAAWSAWQEAVRLEREGLPSNEELLTLAEALSLYANGDKFQRAVELAEAVIRAFAEEAVRLEREALLQDALRYRHMRDNATFHDRNGPGLYWYLPRFMRGSAAEQLDEAVDAAIRARSQEGKG